MNSSIKVKNTQRAVNRNSYTPLRTLFLVIFQLLIPLWVQLAYGSALSQLAGSLQQGQFAELTPMAGFNNGNVMIPTGGGCTAGDYITQYANKAVWNPIARQFQFVGAPHGNCGIIKTVIYNESANSWSVGPQPSSIVQPQHSYDHNTIDPLTGTMYWRGFDSFSFYKMSSAAASWSSIASPPMSSRQCCGALEFFPNMGRLIFIDGDWGIWSYNPASNSWLHLARTSGNDGTSLPQYPMSSYTNFAAYSKLGFLVFGGGSKIYRMDSSGNITSLPSAPFGNVNIGTGAVCCSVAADPATGNIIVIDGSGKLWELNPSSGSWSGKIVNTPSTFTTAGGTGESLISAPIPDYGVIMYVKCNDSTICNVYLYKHGTGTPATPPPPDATPPTTPNGLTATGISSAQVNLAWNAASDNVAVAGYRIFRGGAQIATVASTSFQDTSLSPSTTYSYAVAAYDTAANISGQSSSASATTLDAAAPPPTIAGATLLVKFGKTSALNTFGLSGWSTVIKDIYTENRDIGPGGMAIVVGSHFQYNYQGITGPTRSFLPGEKIRMTWYNNSASAITFTPNITFTAADRIINIPTGWYPMTSTSLPAFGSAASEFTFTSSNAGTYSLVNVNVNYTNSQIIIADQIELITGGGSPISAPTIALSATPSSISAGGASTLAWGSTNATSCNASGGWSGAKSISGSQSTGTLSTNTIFSLTCTGAGGSTTQSAMVTVTNSNPPPPPTTASETVTVNFAVDRGPATQRASGFLHSISNTQPAAAFVNPVKPRLFRCAQSTCFSIYNRVTPLGSAIQLVISDTYGYGGPWPGDGGNFTNWENTVKNSVNQAKTNGYTIQWDIWNEPNHSSFWGASQAQFFEAWRRAFLATRAIDPNAVIVGPSVSRFDQAYIQAFLNFAKTNNVLPNIVSWHEYDGGSVLAANVQTMRTWMANNGVNISRISINEMIYDGEYTSPGKTIRYLAGVERSGVESAAHACWPDGSGNNCFSTRSLDGILTFDGLQARSAWWAYKGYADVTGNVVDLAASTNVDGVAGGDSAQQKASVVLGRTGGTGSVGIRFVNLNSAAYLNGNGTVRVVAQRIPDSGSSALASPTTVIDTNYTITNNEITVILANFSGSEGYTISLTPGTGAGGGTTDTTPPTVSLTAPAANATVSGTVTVSANASDNVGVAGVQFKLNGVNLGSEDTASPYSVSWNSTGVADGSHFLSAFARDAAGNQTASTSILVTVNNNGTAPPPSDTTAPSIPSNLAASAVASTQINISWTASTDNVGVTGYRIFRGGKQIGTATATSYQDSGLSASTNYSYTVAAVDAAGNASGQSSSANATTLAASTPPPPPTTPPSGDFATRCSAPGVAKCVGFDTAADIAGSWGNVSGLVAGPGTVAPVLDTSVKSSGASALKFTVPSNSGAGSSGSYFTNFSNDLSALFGAGEEFYVQWRQRYSADFLATTYDGSNGWKQIILGEGDRAGVCDPKNPTSATCPTSCSQLEIVVQNSFQRGLPQMYHSCGGKDGSYEGLEYWDTNLGNVVVQNAVGCLYGTNFPDPPCVRYKANQWLTFQIHVKIGTWYQNNGNYRRDSSIQMWIAEENKPSKLVIDFSPEGGHGYDIANTNSAIAKYGKLWLLPYNTGKSAAQTHPEGYVWYDDLIISRNKIADPAGSGTTTEQPPSAPTGLILLQ